MLGGEWQDGCDGNAVPKCHLTWVYVNRKWRLGIVGVGEWSRSRSAIDGGSGRVIEHGRHVGGGVELSQSPMFTFFRGSGVTEAMNQSDVDKRRVEVWKFTVERSFNSRLSA